jgi:membrane protein
MRWKQALSLFKESASSWSDDRAPSMGAAISYYSVFSLAPLLVLIIAVAGLFFGADQVQGAVFAQISGLMGDDAARAVDEMLKHAQEPKTGGIATAVSVAVLLFGASTVLAELQSALDIVWRVPAAEKAKGNALWVWIRTRLLTFGMVLALAFLMIISLVFSAAISALGKWWGGGSEALAHVLDLGASFVILTLAFAVIYKFMPSTHIRWRDVWIGAAVTSALFAIGKWAIGLYLGKSDVASSFGLFGSLAIMMVWIYYSAQIFLFGAEFTRVFADRRGSRRESAPTGENAPTAAVPAVQPAANEEVIEHVERVNALAIPPSRLVTPVSRRSTRMPVAVMGAALLAGAVVRGLMRLKKTGL